MADPGAAYPAAMIDENGDQTAGNILQFLDDSNQPEPGGGGGGPSAPYTPAAGEDVTVLQDSDLDPLILGGDDSGGVRIQASASGTASVSVSGDLVALDGTDGASVAHDLFVGGQVTADDLALGGLTGAGEGGRYVGFTATVAPTTGDFLVGDVVVSLNGSAWVCTVAGTPGTWVGLQSVLLAPKDAPTFTGHVTVPQATAVLDAAALNQLTSALTITSGTLPNLGSWVSGTGIVNPVTRQISVVVAMVSSGTAATATNAIAVSPDNTTYTTVGTQTVSTAVNTVGALQLVTSVTVPAGWYIKCTFANATVAASIYY